MVEGVPAAIGARGGALGLVEGDELVIVDPRGATGQTLRPGARLPLTTRAPITTAAREGKPAWAQRRAEFVSRSPTARRWRRMPRARWPCRSSSASAWRARWDSRLPSRTRSRSEVRALARIAADLGGQALERAGLYEQERSSREALDRILAVAPRFQQGATPEAVVGLGLRRGAPRLRLRRGAGLDAGRRRAARGRLARPAERRDPAGHADRLRRLPGPDRGDARVPVDVRPERAAAHARRGAAACRAARPVLVAPDPDRDRRASSSGSSRSSGSA